MIVSVVDELIIVTLLQTVVVLLHFTDNGDISTMLLPSATTLHLAHFCSIVRSEEPCWIDQDIKVCSAPEDFSIKFIVDLLVQASETKCTSTKEDSEHFS
jgi:hypothetical protein